MFEPGRVTPHEVESSYLNRNVKISVYLPKNYTPLYKHQVIIAFDGQDFSQLGQLHRSYEKLYDAGKIERAIIVFVHYKNVDMRKMEYHPEGEQKDAYIQFVVCELLTFIDENFSTLKVGRARTLMGDSLAASIALSITLKYPTIFTHALLFSPMIHEVHEEAVKSITNKQVLDYYLVIGKEEDHFKLMTGEMADFLTPAKAFHELLLEENIEHYFEILDGGHTWKTWKPELEKVLKYFLGT